MEQFQKTLKGEISFEGEGIHTSCYSRVTLKPASESTGYLFIKKTGSKSINIPARLSCVKNAEYCTTLSNEGEDIHTVEHILSALYALSIDNAFIEIEGEEVPYLDGSARPFIEKILEAGTVTQHAPKKYFFLDRNLRYEHPVKKVEILATPYDELRVTVLIDFDTEFRITQYGEMYSLGEYVEKIGSARSFVLLSDILRLYQKGKIKGGRYDNSVVIIDHRPQPEQIEKIKEIFNISEEIVSRFDIRQNYFSVNGLRYENEPARHKILDIIGDMALLGVHLRAHILAARPSHLTNIEFARILYETYQKQLSKGPVYDPSKPPIFTIKDIQRILPHKYPFIYVDKIIEISDTHVVGIKNVTINEHLFTGHFPDNPVLPGVILVEAFAQTGGVFILSRVDDPASYDTYFMRIDKVRFLKPCVPGDTIVLTMELLSPVKRGVCHMYGRAYVAGELVAEGEFIARIIKKEKSKNPAQPEQHTR